MENADFDNIFWRAELKEKLNESVRNWGQMTKTQYLFFIHQLPFAERRMWKKRDPKDILRGSRTVKAGFKLYYGDIVRVRWNFSRHGIFQEHGVGRGRKRGSGKEKPMPWIEKTLNQQVPLLADSLTEDIKRVLGTTIKIKVNGIFEMEIN